jgi:hypothetical protein
VGNRIYILAFRVAKGSLVGRGYIPSWKQDYKTESNKKEKRKDLSYLYIIPVSPGAYNTSQCIRSNWI